MAAFLETKKRLPERRMVIVAGPRFCPTLLRSYAGLGVVPYVHNLSASDLAVVQGTLTAAMELTAHKLPFLHCPLRRQFEWNFHVAPRLERHGAGRRMDFDDSRRRISSQRLPRRPTA
jgi:aminoglycoside phosphotransferase